MDAIDTLMNEHRLIERTLDALIAYSNELRRKGAGAQPEGGASGPEKRELAQFVTFIREFADRCHHGKEEGILFEEMVACGFPADGGPIAVMLREHELGRTLVGALANYSGKAEPWDASDRQQIAATAQEYVTLLRQHIQKEDTILYPMAEARLPLEVMRRVADRAERFEQEQIGPGAHQRLHALAEELVARHAPALGHGEESPGHPHAHACACQGH